MGVLAVSAGVCGHEDYSMVLDGWGTPVKAYCETCRTSTTVIEFDVDCDGRPSETPIWPR
jgi:hypothetical protein